MTGSDAAVLDAICRDGLAHHQAGRLEPARERYQQVLAADPRHFDALHFLGVYCVQTGQLDAAVQLILEALSVRTDVPAAYGNLANALNSLGRHAEAVVVCDQAIALSPGFVDAHGNRGDGLRQLGRLDEALASYDRVAALAPSAPAQFNRATVLRDLGRLDAALAGYDQALSLAPNYPEAHRGRAAALRDLGRLDEAVESYDRAIALRPDYAEAHAGRGNVLLDLGRPEDALASYRVAADLRPDSAEFAGAQVPPLRELRRLDEALAAADREIALGPSQPEAYNRRAAVLYDLLRLDDALADYDQAIALKPDHAEAFNNRGAVLFELRRLDEALASYGQAVALDPEFADAHHNQAMCRLALGDFAAGWAQYEWRWRTAQLAHDNRERAAPLWLGGESLDGRTLLVHAEQGLGDTLQFARYVADVASQAARVIFEVQPGLERLMRGLEPPVEVVTRGDALPPHDLQVPLMSLALALNAAPEDRAPYLHAPPESVAAWASRLPDDGHLRVGLCWAGGQRTDKLWNAIDKRRSVPLEKLAPLAAVDGATLYSLQKGPPAADIEAALASGWAGPEIVDLTAEMKDFADTAAVVANLDLVITCDTAVAHLAGGLGKPVWIFNRFDACWRWLDGRTDTPWYASARLFNQPAPSDWTPVVDEVVSELQALTSSTHPRACGDPDFLP